ncbi:MAG TPA: hypothetical protein VM491_06925 [Burkholderiaceae bacterium]|jgi:hypothetical protein|nr:hypothetical protein [Burkholderiaceae bacterium]
MQVARGTIVVAQEQRFQLELASGGRRLFLLAPTAGLLDRDLKRLAAAQTEVEVHYRPLEGLIAASAEKVLALAPGSMEGSVE